jgi:hypothetical protein
LLCLGDSVRIPTTGLAIDAAMLARDPLAVTAMRAAFAAALRVVHESDDDLRVALSAAGLVEDRDAGHACSLVREFYSRDGRVPVTGLLAPVQRFAGSMNAPVPDDVEDLYACS